MAPKKKAAAEAADDNPDTKKSKGGLAVGDLLPDFVVETDESTPAEPKTISSKDMVADNGVVIFFYPQANTGGCTTQACGFRDNYDKLVAAGYKVYGMSADKPAAQLRWKEKNNFQYPLLSDPSREALKALGVHKGPKSINRSHIIVEKGGKVLAVEYGVKPKDSVNAAVEFCVKDVDVADATDADATVADAADAAVPDAADAADAAVTDAADAAEPAEPDAAEPAEVEAPEEEPAEDS